MIFVWILMAGVLLLPFFLGVYAGYKDKQYDIPRQHSASDNEHEQTALLKKQVDILDKNRRESWTSPTYFKK